MFQSDYCPCLSPDLWKEEDDEDKYFPETQWIEDSFTETYRDESGSETNISDDTNNSFQNDDDSDTPTPPTKIPQPKTNLVHKSSNVRSINKVSKIDERRNPADDPPVPSVGVYNVKKNKMYIVDESSDCDSEPENSNVKSLGVKIPHNRDGHVRSEQIFPAAKPSNLKIKSLIKPGTHQRVMGFEVTPDALPDSSDSDDNIKSTPTKKTVAFSFSFSKNKENLKSEFDKDIYSSAEVKNWLETHGKSQSRWIISHDQLKKKRFEKWEDYCLLYYIIKDKLVHRWNSLKVWEEMKCRYNYLSHRSVKSILNRFYSHIIPQIKSYGVPESMQEEIKNVLRKNRP